MINSRDRAEQTNIITGVNIDILFKIQEYKNKFIITNITGYSQRT